ncbi:MAG: WbqC family protein [Prevotellaceae bacterium]|nr:WbqC family protein [Prevotellaceae bacterium]
MKRVLLTTAYLPPVVYFTKLLAYDQVLVEQYDHYRKQSYRNRCVIAGPDGPLTLTVPVVKPEGEKCYVKDIRISDHGNWRRLHWNALVSAYNQTPFFTYYQDDLRPFYEKRYDFLLDFNEALCRHLCDLMEITPHLSRTDSYRAAGDILDADDLRDSIHPKHGHCQADPFFTPAPYYQVFQDRLGFLPDLSIVDLLFNMGRESLLVLQKSIVPPPVSA